jgi:hypothetical protein
LLAKVKSAGTPVAGWSACTRLAAGIAILIAAIIGGMVPLVLTAGVAAADVDGVATFTQA